MKIQVTQTIDLLKKEAGDWEECLVEMDIVGLINKLQTALNLGSTKVTLSTWACADYSGAIEKTETELTTSYIREETDDEYNKRLADEERIRKSYELWKNGKKLGKQ